MYKVSTRRYKKRTAHMNQLQNPPFFPIHTKEKKRKHITEPSIPFLSLPIPSPPISFITRSPLLRETQKPKPQKLTERHPSGAKPRKHFAFETRKVTWQQLSTYKNKKQVPTATSAPKTGTTLSLTPAPPVTGGLPWGAVGCAPPAVWLAPWQLGTVALA